MTAGSAALLAENRKHNSSDKKCDELGWACIPLVVETYGCWGAEAVAAFSKLAGRLSIRNNELKSKTIFSLYSRLGLSLVRANRRAIMTVKGLILVYLIINVHLFLLFPIHILVC